MRKLRHPPRRGQNKGRLVGRDTVPLIEEAGESRRLKVEIPKTEGVNVEPDGGGSVENGGGQEG